MHAALIGPFVWKAEAYSEKNLQEGGAAAGDIKHIP